MTAAGKMADADPGEKGVMNSRTPHAMSMSEYMSMPAGSTTTVYSTVSHDGVQGLGVEVQTVMVRGVKARVDGVRKVPGFERFEEVS